MFRVIPIVISVSLLTAACGQVVSDTPEPTVLEAGTVNGTSDTSKTHGQVATIVEAFCVGLIDSYDELRQAGDPALPISQFEATFGYDYQFEECLVDAQEGGEIYEAAALGGSYEDPTESGYVSGCAVPWIAATDEAQPDLGLAFAQQMGLAICGGIVNPFAVDFFEEPADYGMSYEVRLDGLCWRSTGAPDAIKEGAEGFEWCD